MSSESENEQKTTPEESEQQRMEPQPGDQTDDSPDDDGGQNVGQLRGDGLNKTIDDPSAPDWARGKSVQALIEQTQAVMDSFNQPQQQSQPQPQQMNQSGQNVNAQRQQWQQAQQQVQSGPAQQNQQWMQNQPSQTQPSSPPDPDLYYEDPNEYNRQLSAWQQQQTQQYVQQASQPLLQQNAEIAKEQSRNDPKFKEVWQKYEPEIVSHMQSVPLQNRTKRAWDMAAKITKADHMDELVAEQAERKASQMASGAPATQRPGGAPDGGQRTYRDAIDELWDSDHEYIKHAKRQELTADDLRRRADAMDVSYEQFAENIQKQTMISSPAGLTQKSG